MSAIGSNPWARPMIQPQQYGGVQQPQQGWQTQAPAPFYMQPQQSPYTQAPQYAQPTQQAQPSLWNNLNNNYLQPAWNGIKQGASYVGNMVQQHPYAATGVASGIAGAAMGCPYAAGAGAVSALSGYMMNKVQ